MTAKLTFGFKDVGQARLGPRPPPTFAQVLIFNEKHAAANTKAQRIQKLNEAKPTAAAEATAQIKRAFHVGAEGVQKKTRG